MSTQGGCEVTRNNFQQIARSIVEAAAETVADTTNRIEGDIRANRWDSKMPVKVRFVGGQLQAHVVVGSRKHFWAGFAEYGTISQGAKPVVGPAAERARRPFVSQASAVLQRIAQLGK